MNKAQDLQHLLDLIFSLAARAGLHFNPRKCYTMHYSNKPPAGCRATKFKMNNILIPHLEDGDTGIFLGKPIGAFVPKDTVTINNLKEKATKILTSKLAPWQRIDCLKTFFYPSLLFMLRTDQFDKGAWQEVDDHIRPMLKRTLGLPPNAANAYIYGSKKDGLFGIPLAADDSDLAHIDGAMKLLTSKDRVVEVMAWDEVRETANYRMDSTLDTNIQDFLNSAPSAKNSNRYKSHWTRARIASKRLNAVWEIKSDSPVTISFSEEHVVSDRSKVFNEGRDFLRKKKTLELRSRPHQGKTNEPIAADSASSHFFHDGSYTQFKDWRFVHRARLGLVKLNAYNHGPGQGNKRCRRDETLPHVLCHCMIHSTLYKKRHNAIVARLKKAASAQWTIIGEDTAVGSTNLRPDLTIKRGTEILILDATVPFENGLQALVDARTLKENKYADLAKELSKDGNVARVEAIVVGALGSWDPKNDKVLRRICSKKYMKMMKKIMVSETIAYSQDIFREHIDGIPQDSGGRAAGRQH